MKKAQLLTRTLGRHLTFPSTSLAHLLTRKNDILEAINRHGCICIKNVDFREKEMVQFTKGIWDQVIELPGFLCFNNRDEIYRQVARVGNIKLDGTLKDSQKEANYWHQDGEFWGEGKKHIYNCLHTREEPEKGGQTHIMDLVKGAQFLRQKKPEMFRKLQNLIGQVNIEQIYDFKLYNAKNILNIEGTTRHKLVVHDPKTNTQRLFLSVLELLDPATMKQSKELGIQEVLETLQNEMGFYAHKWEQGDLVIWDNLQVMHRSSGSFEGRRLLFRTQGRFNN